MFGDAQVRTGHLLIGMLKTPSLRNALLGDLARVRARSRSIRLTDDFDAIVGGSPEDGAAARDGSSQAAPGEAQRRDRAGGDGQAGGAEAVHRST